MSGDRGNGVGLLRGPGPRPKSCQENVLERNLKRGELRQSLCSFSK